MNPYKVLGIAEDEQLPNIKRAYRKLVKTHHPDKGGDRQTFERIQKAYDILSDPERREHYDETGDTGEDRVADKQRNEHLVILQDLFTLAVVKVIKEGGRPKNAKLLELMQDSLDKEVETQKQQIPICRKYHEELITLQGRFTTEDESDPLTGIIQAKIAEQVEKIEQMYRRLDQLGAVSLVLDNYRFNHEPVIGPVFTVWRYK